MRTQKSAPSPSSAPHAHRPLRVTNAIARVGNIVGGRILARDARRGCIVGWGVRIAVVLCVELDREVQLGAQVRVVLRVQRAMLASMVGAILLAFNV